VTKLTVTVITYNESAHIVEALQSVSWADEIILVDSHSTDDTVERARPYVSRIDARDWSGYGTQKNHAQDLASNDWILSIDADERVAAHHHHVTDGHRKRPVDRLRLRQVGHTSRGVADRLAQDLDGP